MVPPLSSADENRIRKALEVVADATSEGEEPNDAIVKAAADAELPAGHVDLLVRAYNVARTTWQRQSGADVFEKAAEFPLADVDTVRQRLFRDHVKEAHVTLPPCADYEGTPHWYRHRQEEFHAQKLAKIELPPLTDRKAPPLQEDPKILAKRAMNAARDRLRALEIERGEVGVVQTQLERAFAKIASVLELLGAPGLKDLRPDVEVLFGKVGTAILNQVGRMKPVLEKRAAGYVQPVDLKKEPYVSIAQAVRLTTELQQKLARYEKAAASCDEAVLRHLSPYLHDEPGAEDDDLLSGLGSNRIDVNPLQEKVANPAINFAGNVGLGVATMSARDMLSGLGNKLQDTSEKERAVNRMLGRISSPDHEEELRAIQTQAMLHDLLMNDPVISGYDPHEVAQAFNELSQLAPRTAAQPVLARSLLRKQLQLGALDSFEGNEAVKTEHNLRELNPVYSASPKEQPGAARTGK